MTPEQLLAQVEFFGSSSAVRAVAAAAGDPKAAAIASDEAETALRKVKAAVTHNFAAELAAVKPVVEAAKAAVREIHNSTEIAGHSNWLNPVAHRLIAAVDALNGTRTPPEPGDLREQLAAIEHARWADWQRYMHGLCDRGDDGSLTIPANLVTRWEQQIAMPYAELSEKEKDSDREQVDRYWHLIAGKVQP